MRRPSGPAPRPGFTLTELLVVIAIIGVLAALTTAAVQRVRGVGQRTTAVSEINQLAIATQGFKQQFGFYPPSVFTVPKLVNSNDPNFALLRRMYPRWQIYTSPTATAPNPSPNEGDPIYWPNSAAGKLEPFLFGGTVLDGNQCLLYFLAGPVGLLPGGDPSFTVGWDQTNPWPVKMDPATGNSASNKKGPFYDFPGPRLKAAFDPALYGNPSSPTPNPTPNGLPWYTDPWGSPYAFFAAGASGYQPVQTVVVWNGNSATTTQSPLKFPLNVANQNDKWNTTIVTPYRSGNKWVNADNIQIVSAGPNKQFGRGSILSVSPLALANWPSDPNLGADYTQNGAGNDDLANFNGGVQLGLGSQQ